MYAKILVSSDRSTHIVGLGWEGAISLQHGFAYRCSYCLSLGGMDFEEWSDDDTESEEQAN